MKNRLLGILLLAAGSLFSQVSLGIRIGPPPRPRIYARTAAPGPGYTYVDGYWYPEGGRYRWHNPYWTRPPYEGAVWIGPNHDGQQFFNGHWEGPRGRIEHDHHDDRRHNRDRHER